ncbi:hypothetical protein V5O48_016971 [Marasmius crinis-equi]|uniref:HAT C-terminal dimerisation domain-containing protein n=1 Tax=Marasmius crinis-equi TaxID=585013 RepID=A0ABR3EQ86_9AGAR
MDVDELDWDNIDNYGSDTMEDVFQAHISSGQEPNIEDVIKHHCMKLAPSNLTIHTSTHMFARMALDFLSTPAASTDVEHLFSHGGLNWLFHEEDIVLRKKLVKGFNEKHLRRKKSKRKEGEDAEEEILVISDSDEAE